MASDYSFVVGDHDGEFYWTNSDSVLILQCNCLDNCIVVKRFSVRISVKKFDLSAKNCNFTMEWCN